MNNNTELQTSEQLEILTDKDIKDAIFALLFTYGDPLSAEDLRDTIDESFDLRIIKRCLRELSDELYESDGAVQLFNFNNKYQLGTNKKYSKYVEKIVSPSKKKTLTRAAIETLTIIAYKQPITRIEVEDIRGVKSNAVFDSLLSNELIEVCGIAPKIGRPKLYRTTDNFLKAIGISDLNELPNIESHQNKQISLL